MISGESQAPELRDLDFALDANLELQYLDETDASKPVRGRACRQTRHSTQLIAG